MDSYIVEMDEVTSLDGVTVRPGDAIELMTGEVCPVFWVGVQKPSYLHMIGVEPQHEHGAVFFRHIKGLAND
jgi:hypothetical protein